jgi:hypothetical protein
MKVFFSFLMLFITISASAQSTLEKPYRFPIGLADYKQDSLYVKITYGRATMEHDMDKPFGDYVPYGELWRFGEDHATEIHTTQDIYFGKKVLPAGSYALFAVPDSMHWNIIVNKELGQWGTFKYDSTKNLFTHKFELLRSPKVIEKMTIYFDEYEGEVDLMVMWDRAVVRIPINNPAVLEEPE